MYTHHCYITNYNHATAWNGERLVACPIYEGLSTLGDILGLAVKYGFTHIWIPEGVTFDTSPEAMATLRADCEDLLLNWEPSLSNAPNTLISVFARKRQEGIKRYRPVNIMFLPHLTWEWAHTPQLLAETLFSIVSQLENDLHVPVAGSPAGVGSKYLISLYAKQDENGRRVLPSWLCEKHTKDYNAIPWGQGAKPLLFDRSPSDEELDAAGYVVCIDKNAAHPRAACEEKFGTCEPVYMTADEILNAGFDPRTLPGLYNVTKWDPARVDPQLGSLIRQGLIPNIIWQSSQWFFNPTIKAAMKLGYEPVFTGGYVFPENGHIYRKWAKELWEKRHASNDPAIVGSYKQVMNDFLGRTRSAKLPCDSWEFRPDHNGIVVDGTRAVMFYNIVNLALQGYYPVMVQLDALYYLLPSNQVRQHLASKYSPDSFGGYKIKWCLPLNKKVREVLQGTLTRTRKLQQLNLLAEKLNTVKEEL